MKAESRYILILAHGALSLAEAASYLESEGFEYRVISSSKRVAVIEAEGLDAEGVIGRLGGLYKIGRVSSTIRRGEASNIDYVKGELDSVDFYSQLGEKVLWCISAYSGDSEVDPEFQGFLQDYFTERLKRDGAKKARYILPRGPPEDTDLDREIISEDIARRGVLKKGLEVLVASMPEGYHIGSTSAVVKSEEFRMRDLERPAQRSIISMPPKVARILVNLTGLSRGETLLDPFCGVGTILQEAVTLGLDIVGVDIDGQRVSETIRNLKWLSDRYGLKIEGLSRKVFRADARRISRYIECIDGMATEPILLPPLRRYPSEAEAESMLKRSGETYAEAIFEMASVLKKSGRLAIVVPYVKTGGGREFSFSIEDMIRASGLRLYRPSKGPAWSYPLMVSPGRGQKVLRGVYVLERV